MGIFYMFVISYQNALLWANILTRPSYTVSYPAGPSMKKQFVRSLCIISIFYYQIEYNACSLVMCLDFFADWEAFGLKFCLKMSFAVVELDDETECYSINWLLNGTTCYWPAYRALRLMSAVEKREEPPETWSKCVLRFICYYGLYTITVYLYVLGLTLMFE